VRQSGLVASISDSTVWRWLHADAIRPWQHRTWIFPRDPQFPLKAGARVGDTQSWNACVYALSDPVNRIDHSGLCSYWLYDHKFREDRGIPCSEFGIIEVTAEPPWGLLNEIAGALAALTAGTTLPISVDHYLSEETLQSGGGAGGGDGNQSDPATTNPSRPEQLIPQNATGKVLPPGMNGPFQAFKQRTRGYPKPNIPTPRAPVWPQVPAPVVNPPVPIHSVPWYKSVPLKLLELLDTLKSGSSILIMVDPCLMSPYTETEPCYEKPGA
jgi:hypothetical protein